MLGYPFGWWIAAGLFLLLIVAVFMSRVVIHGTAKRIGTDDHAELRIRGLMGLIHYHWEMPVMKMKGSGVEVKREKSVRNIGGDSEQTSKDKVDAQSVIRSIDWMNMLLKQTDSLLGWLKTTLNHVHMTEWRWRTAVGTGDAMWTAMATGMVWTIKTTAIGVLSQMIRLKTDPQISVEPVYASAHFSTEWHFTVKLRFGYMIFAGIYLLFKMRHMRGIFRGLVGWQRILLRA
ncbi:DUF2953 domain-containing protein [Paenibacillus aurantiacus]|uniref:DUF2953 domain-containing protein n=1 Tax=Paenibacillus aurantiacus TaxID=1936118 RepID=A0ABV5KJD7_9BACL